MPSAGSARRMPVFGAAVALGASLLPAAATAGSWPPPQESQAVCAGSTPGGVSGLVVESYDPATGAMSLSYQPACGATDHHIEYGPLSAVSVLGYSDQQCGLGVSGSVAAFQPGPGSYFFLIVASNDGGQEGSYGLMNMGGVTMERPANPGQTSCPFTQDLSAACDGPTPLITLGMTAYRPQTEAYGAPFQRTAVPAADLAAPGAGVRVNGDDDNSDGTPDRDQSMVTGENDLVELVLSADPPCANGIDYVLTRSTPGLQVWADSGKQTPLLVGTDEAVLTFPGSTMTVWVESIAAGAGDVALEARNGSGGVVTSRSGHFFGFSAIVIALGGESQVPGDPPPEPGNFGMFQLAIQLYRLGYDVHMYDEDVVAADGSGAAYNEVVRAIQERSVSRVAVFGYSHGGGSTVDLAIRLNNNRAGIGAFDIAYTAYVDAIRNNSDIDLATETELPPTTMFHANYYQNPGCGLFSLCGGPINGADINLNVNTTAWGAGLTHFTVDDAPEVLGAIRGHILGMVTP